MRNFVKWWSPVIVWMGLIFMGSSIGSLPRVGGKTSDAVVHRVAHVIEFAVLGALLLRASSKDRPVTRRDLMVAVLGDKGRHARSAVGTNALPNGMAVEIEMVVEVE